MLQQCPLESAQPSVSGYLWLFLDTAGCVALSEHCDQLQYLYQTYVFDIFFIRFDKADEIVIFFYGQYNDLI